jgi:hypothetical protein
MTTGTSAGSFDGGETLIISLAALGPDRRRIDAICRQFDRLPPQRADANTDRRPSLQKD